ncbi:MAG TPA: methyltransferase domain-containing protein [Solirubrobacteraceae bacterium]|nr:methyltransferase domain-containing protein [Solirubrobacteraceae bacterium]
MRTPREAYWALRPVRWARRDGIGQEIAFWRDFLTSHGAQWPDDYERRIDPGTAIRDPALIACVEALHAPRINLLDVGAGPLTSVGRTHPGRTVDVTAVDPLAPAYDRLLEELRVEPPTRTVTGSAERLLEHFAPASFDIAYAQNALDHGLDPRRGIRNMLEVVRPGGFVVLRHLRNEAATERYTGLHRWNLERRGDELYLWRRVRAFARNITAALAPSTESSSVVEGDGDVVATFRKRRLTR